ncbi:hypothetical protein [Paraburkholderia atlantica]|uniref:hypothetical protein n=1 Tax=Paraburkholderia atlantica TaxID=2654982 RepID=UPI0016154FC5|nr:hypothetical protein [Paraburkholderia atlantica]MBB5414040.1 hypothetical protein [Paraburkholderia atlantica]
MTEKWRCAHGFGLSEPCRECELDNAREVEHRFGKLVDEARAKIAGADRARVRSLPLLMGHLVDAQEVKG